MILWRACVGLHAVSVERLLHFTSSGCMQVGLLMMHGWFAGGWVASQRFPPSGYVSAAFPGRTSPITGRPAPRGSSSPRTMGITHASTLPRDPMRASTIVEHQREEDASSSGVCVCACVCSPGHGGGRGCSKRCVCVCMHACMHVVDHYTELRLLSYIRSQRADFVEPHSVAMC